jgi:hypothetical protein
VDRVSCRFFPQAHMAGRLTGADPANPDRDTNGIRMDGRDLDTLMEGLQSCASEAQRRLDRHQERLLKQLIDIGRDGEPKSLSWICRLPSGTGAQRDVELLRLPWASLRSAEAMRIGCLSVSLDCRVDQSKTRTDAEPEVRLRPVARAKKNAGDVHRLLITAGEIDGFQAEARLDGQLFKAVGDEKVLLPRDTLLQWARDSRRIRRMSGLKWAVLLMIGLSAFTLSIVLWYLQAF